MTRTNTEKRLAENVEPAKRWRNVFWIDKPITDTEGIFHPAGPMMSHNPTTAWPSKEIAEEKAAWWMSYALPIYTRAGVTLKYLGAEPQS